jgi:hypothetical protein
MFSNMFRIFRSASAFDQNLCAWGAKMNAAAPQPNVGGMFASSGCDSPDNSQFTSSPNMNLCTQICRETGFVGSNDGSTCLSPSSGGEFAVITVLPRGYHITGKTCPTSSCSCTSLPSPVIRTQGCRRRWVHHRKHQMEINLDNVVIDFQESVDSSKFVLNYVHDNIFAGGEGADASASFEIRTIDCADSDATNDQPSLVDALDFSSRSSAVTANINVDFATIATSPYWFQEATAAFQNTIEFCARLEVVDSDGTGVNFAEAKVIVAIDLPGDFLAVTGYSVERDAISKNTGGVDVGVTYPIKRQQR